MTQEPSPTLARQLREKIVGLLEGVPEPRRTEITGALSKILDLEIAQERSRYVQACRDRALLWKNTQMADASAAYARQEARARYNEATYLADLLEQLPFGEPRVNA